MSFSILWRHSTTYFFCKKISEWLAWRKMIKLSDRLKFVLKKEEERLKIYNANQK